MNKIKHLSMIALAVAVLCGCATYSKHTDYTGVNGGYALSQTVPMKDYESKGLVFASVMFNSNAAQTVSEDKSVVAFELLKKAQAIGADDIINVRIIRKTTRESLDTNSDSQALSATTEYYGSALAIKYTNALLCGGQHLSKGGEESKLPPAMPSTRK